MTTRVGLYVRVSTQEQASDGYSIGEQEERLRKYAMAHDWSVVDVYTDAGFSGGNMHRPALSKLIDDCKRGKLDKVVVYKLDRLSRSQKDTLYLIENVFKVCEVGFVSMTENFDTGSPLGIAMIGILSVFAQLEREQIKERMQLGLDARAKDGLFHGGGFDPIGYDYIDGQLMVNEFEAMQVKRVYSEYLDGMAISGITSFMNKKGYKLKSGKLWTDTAVKSVLTTPLYAGKIAWKGNVYDGKHEALVDEKTFIKVQGILKKRAGMFRPNPFKRTTLLGGLLFCGNCGARYYCKQNTLKKTKVTNPDAKPQKYYTCYSRGKGKSYMIKDPNCKNKNWNMKALDKLVLDEIAKLATNPSLLTQNGKTGNNSDTGIIQRQIEKIDDQIAKLVQLFQIGSIDFNMISTKVDDLNKEKQQLTEQLETMEEQTPVLSIKETKNILRTFDDAMKNANQDELKKIVHGLIDGIIIRDEDVEIHWKFN